MDIRTLQYFVAVADLLSFSQAAKSLYVSQSTLSQQILDLEEELGTPLLERKNRTTSLTDAGKVMLVEAKELLYRAEQLKDDVRNARPDNYANLSLVIGYSINHINNAPLRHIISRSVANIRKQYPGIALSFQQFDGGNLQKELLSSSIDICLASGHHGFSSQNLSRTVIWEEDLVLGFSKEFPQPTNREELRRFLMSHPVHLYSQNIDGLAYIMGLFSELEVAPSIRFFDNSYDILLSAEAGEAIMITPQSTFDRACSLDLQCCNFMDVTAKLRTSIIWKDQNTNEMINVFRALLEEELIAYNAKLNN